MSCLLTFEAVTIWVTLTALEHNFITTSGIINKYLDVHIKSYARVRDILVSEVIERNCSRPK